MVLVFVCVCVWVAVIEGSHNDSMTACVSTCLPNAMTAGDVFFFYLVLKKLSHTHFLAALTMSSLYSLISHLKNQLLKEKHLTLYTYHIVPFNKTLRG